MGELTFYAYVQVIPVRLTHNGSVEEEGGETITWPEQFRQVLPPLSSSLLLSSLELSDAAIYEP